jgi:alcohol dehydrogenase class IV
MSVILTAPAAFRFTYPTSPERHLRAAKLLGVPVGDLDEATRPEALPRALVALMRDVGIPNGLAAVGYTERDAGALVDGTLQQPRLLANTPRSVSAGDLDDLVGPRPESRGQEPLWVLVPAAPPTEIEA